MDVSRIGPFTRAALAAVAAGAMLLLLPPGAAAVAPGGGPTEAAAVDEVSRMSDREVRERLIGALSRDSAGRATHEEEFNPAFILNRLQQDAGRLVAELDTILGAVGELPGILPEAWRRFSADRTEGGVLDFAVALAVSMGAGLLAALAVRWRLARELAPMTTPQRPG